MTGNMFGGGMIVYGAEWPKGVAGACFFMTVLARCILNRRKRPRKAKLWRFQLLFTGHEHTDRYRILQSIAKTWGCADSWSRTGGISSLED